jgi:hypothetical protein
MPARQDQTLQIFLIICIFAFLVTAVVAYFGWSSYGEASQEATSLKTQLADKNTAVQNQQTEIGELRQMIGFDPNDNSADVKSAVEDDMKKYGAGVADENSRSYRKVLETVYTDWQKTAQREASLEEERKKLTTTAQAVEAAAKQQIDEYDAQRKKAEENLAAEQNKFNAHRAEMEKTQAQLAKTVEDQKTAFEEKVAEWAAEKQQLDEKIAELERAKTNLLAQRKDEPSSFEVADGRISWVNQDGTVWINLGTADALRPQVTFSVFEAGPQDADKAAKKASIEVTRLMGEHMAEARVVEDDPTNPILPGDSIYSQVWHRGKKLHFALTGLVDLDGDGRSDLELAQDLIELNGGVVDAYLADDGTVQGKITANTRYLVLGESTSSTSTVNLEVGWSQMQKDATSLGVETITLSQFLSQMGYRPQARTVQLGSGATGRDFPAQPDDYAKQPGAGQQFRPRTPYRPRPAAVDTEE